MLYIETQGPWRQMGRQFGEAFADTLHQCIEHYCPYLVSDADRLAPVIAELRENIESICPDLLEETLGTAEAAKIPAEHMIGYRFRTDLRRRMNPGCSVVFTATERYKSLLAANTDIETRLSPEIQVCHTRRPVNQPATITATYMGLAGTLGLNEHGLGIGGASAKCAVTYGKEGVNGDVLLHRVLYESRDVAEALALVNRYRFVGKPMNILIADAGGASALLEFAVGRKAVQLPRDPQAWWQVCTNFFLSGELPIQPQPDYLRSAYARYGRLLHLFALNAVAGTPEGLAALLADVAQPGFCCTDNDKTFQTAYARVMNLESRTMHLYPGHPGEVQENVLQL